MVAWIRDEPAASQVEVFLREAQAGGIELVMSWINVAETFYILGKGNSPAVAENFLTRLPTLPLRVASPSADDIMSAARLKARHAIAFGDAFAIALAQAEGAAVITGDHEIRRCRIVPVEWVGTARN